MEATNKIQYLNILNHTQAIFKSDVENKIAREPLMTHALLNKNYFNIEQRSLSQTAYERNKHHFEKGFDRTIFLLNLLIPDNEAFARILSNLCNKHLNAKDIRTVAILYRRRKNYLQGSWNQIIQILATNYTVCPEHIDAKIAEIMQFADIHFPSLANGNQDKIKVLK